MIIGAVNAYREALIRLKIFGPEGREQEVEAIVDTGFTGTLALPAAMKMRGVGIEKAWFKRRRGSGVRQLAAALISRACSRPHSQDAYSQGPASKLAWGKR